MCNSETSGWPSMFVQVVSTVQLKSSWQCPSLIISFSIRAYIQDIVCTKCKVAAVTPQRSDMFKSLCFCVFLCAFSGLPNIFVFLFNLMLKFTWRFCLIEKKLHLKSNSWCIWLKKTLATDFLNKARGNWITDIEIFNWSQPETWKKLPLCITSFYLLH